MKSIVKKLAMILPIDPKTANESKVVLARQKHLKREEFLEQEMAMPMDPAVIPQIDANNPFITYK